MAIDSVNPALVPGARGEVEIAEYCAGWLAAHGFAVHRLADDASRPSIVGLAAGNGGGPSLMFNGHIDTVTTAGYAGDPFAALRREGRLYGRGAYDMKGGVAAMMVAAARARELGLTGDVLVACVADEEHASLGTAEVLRHFHADAAIVTEPTHLEPCIAHKGFAWFDILIHGRAAHGSMPEQGIDAITRAGHFLVALEQLDQRLRASPSHGSLGTGSIHASLIRGGEEMSSYPAACRISIERRTVPGETAQSVAAEIAAILGRIRAEQPDFRADLEPGLVRAPFAVGEDEVIVDAVQRAAAGRLGVSPALGSRPFWTDCALFQEAGIPAVLFGASGGGAHTVEEWADEASVLALCDILLETARSFCTNRQ